MTSSTPILEPSSFLALTLGLAAACAPPSGSEDRESAASVAAASVPETFVVTDSPDTPLVAALDLGPAGALAGSDEATVPVRDELVPVELDGARMASAVMDPARECELYGEDASCEDPNAEVWNAGE